MEGNSKVGGDALSRGAYRRAGGLNGRRVAAPPKRSHSQSDSSSGLQGWVVVSSTASSGVRGGLGPAETQLHTPRPQPRRLRQKEPLPGVCQSNIRVSATSTGWGPLRARHRLVPGTEDNECTSACLPASLPSSLTVSAPSPAEHGRCTTPCRDVGRSQGALPARSFRSGFCTGREVSIHPAQTAVYTEASFHGASVVHSVTKSSVRPLAPHTRGHRAQVQPAGSFPSVKA